MVRGLRVTEAVVRFGDVTAVDRVNLHLAPGDVLALLGPSGSGKSTLLRAIAGLQPLTLGNVYWDGRDMTTVKVHKRGFGMVFQDGQLFANMNVGRNVAYGLGALERDRRRERVAEMLELVGLAGYESRKVTELSGGQAQRVALARSLAPAPDLLLLDEPLSALELGLRRHLAGELAQILREVGSTAIHVTHDQEEASQVGDTVAVMMDGQILQRARPDALWQEPASEQVARFLGHMAFIPADEARGLGWSGQLPPGHLVGLRPGSLELDDEGTSLRVLDQSFSPGQVQIGVELPGGQRAVVASETKAQGSHVRVRMVGGTPTPT